MIRTSRQLDYQFSQAMQAYNSGDVRGMKRVAHELRNRGGEGKFSEGVDVTAANIERIAETLEQDLDEARSNG